MTRGVQAGLLRPYGRGTPSWAWMILGPAVLACCACAASVVRAASPPPLLAPDGMVVSECPTASWVGAEILLRGGNAVDAAIAVHFALAVAYPQAGNLGGGGFLLLYMSDGTAEAIDFREKAPAAAGPEIYVGADGRPDAQLSTATLLATAVPGSVAGLALAHERHGTLAWKDLIAPAIALAEGGVVIDRYTAEHLERFRGRLERHPETRRVLLRDGAHWVEGDTLRQPELAATLRRIARFGSRDFYEGETAKLLLAEMERGGGLITAEDLRGYRAVVRAPLIGHYRGLSVLTMPPPSSGGATLLEMLGMLERFPLAALGSHSLQATHLLIEVMKRAFADRAEFLGDPDFTPLPIEGLIAAGYADSVGRTISQLRATPSRQVAPGTPRGAAAFYAVTGTRPGVGGLSPERAPANSRDAGGSQDPDSPRGEMETTHISIVDRVGNAVAMTTTMNTNYGNGIMVTGAGFLLNNEMDDFSLAPGVPNHYGLLQGAANSVRPFARPLSSMAPTIVLQGDTVALVLGSPDGPRIISSVLQVLVNAVDFRMDIQEAIDAPRVHQQWWPDTAYVEPGGLVNDVRAGLEARGHALGTLGAIGSVQGIAVRARPGAQRWLLGAADPRRNGCAVGVNGRRLVSRFMLR